MASHPHLVNENAHAFGVCPECNEQVFGDQSQRYCDELGCYMHTECYEAWKEKK